MGSSKGDCLEVIRDLPPGPHWSVPGGIAERGRWRGHKIVCDPDGAWRYVDTGEAVASLPDRICGRCDEANTTEGHDACLGTLSDVENACCGHGHDADAFIVLTSGQRIAGYEALEWVKNVGLGL